MPFPQHLVETLDDETLERFRDANGGHAGHMKPQPVTNSLSRNWQIGLPVHWVEESIGDRTFSIIQSTFFLLRVIASVCYLQFRARRTIGAFSISREMPWFLFQILFLIYEITVVFLPLTTVPEWWKLSSRKCISLSRIPTDVLPFRNGLPVIAVIIPCYKEPADMVLSVVRATTKFDYPRQLLHVYLCDDGKDPAKQFGISKMRSTRVHYTTRQDNMHAKPGNVNNVLRNLPVEIDFVVQLDADFIPSRDFLQKLIPYYLVWNPSAQKYDVNETLAYVQTPQYYRNSHDSTVDWLDQRNAFFFRHAQRGKDWFNACTMVGTANLINVHALKTVGFFPTFTFGDDTALSLIFHAAGYFGYYVNEKVATGLVPPTLRGHFSQRSRWHKSDWQILFSRSGPLTAKGLTFIQRVAHFNVIVQRSRGLFTALFEILLIIVLVSGFFLVDVRQQDVSWFTAFLVPHLIVPVLMKIFTAILNPEAHESITANEMFEEVFRYATLKGMIQTFFSGNSGWKVAEKGNDTREDSSSSMNSDTMVKDGISYDEEHESGACDDKFGQVNGPVENSNGSLPTTTTVTTRTATTTDTSTNGPMMARSFSIDIVPNDENSGGVHKTNSETATVIVKSETYISFVLHNLKRCWYSILMVMIFSTVIIFSIIRAPSLSLQSEFSSQVSRALAFAYLASAMIPHLLLLCLCYKRQFVSAKQHGNKSWNWMVTILGFVREAIILVALIYTIIMSMKYQREDAVAREMQGTCGNNLVNGQCRVFFTGNH